MSDRNYTQRFFVIGFSVALTLMGLLSSRALAQGEIDDTVRRAAELSEDQKAKVQDYVAKHSANLNASDAQDLRKDREALLRQLMDPQVSSAFRIEFSKRLEPVLNPLVGSTNEKIAISAVVIASELATAPAATMLIDAASAEKPAVRFQAAYGMRRTFEALSKMASPTLTDEGVSNLVRAIGARIVSEPDALVIDELVLAGIESAKVGRYRVQALTTVCGSLNTRAKGQASNLAPESMQRAFLRAASGVRDVLSGSNAGQLPPDALKACAGMAGQFIAYCVRVVEGRGLPAGGEHARGESTARDVHSQLASASETVILLATELSGTKAPGTKNLGSKLKSGKNEDDARFGEDARLIVGPGGLLSKDPFKFSDGEFVSAK